MLSSLSIYDILNVTEQSSPRFGDIFLFCENKKVLTDVHAHKIFTKDILFGCTGTIGESFPYDQVASQIPNLVNKIRYTQNKFIWMITPCNIFMSFTLRHVSLCNLCVYEKW